MQVGLTSARLAHTGITRLSVNEFSRVPLVRREPDCELAVLAEIC
jgi:hypothetical protein